MLRARTAVLLLLIACSMPTFAEEELTAKARPDIPQRVLDVLPQEVDAVIMDNMVTFKDMIIPLYGKYYTGAEVKEMIRFYSTPLGKKTIETMPAIIAEGYQLGQRWGQGLGPGIQARVQARLKKEGYDLEQQPEDAVSVHP